MDDVDILCDPLLVTPNLTSSDQANARMAGERNTVKTKVLYFTDAETMARNVVSWRLDDVRSLAAAAFT